MSFKFRQPLFSKEESVYIAGFETQFLFFHDTMADYQYEETPPEKAFLQLEIGIVGMFISSGGRFSEEIELNLVRIQAPALLMPYVRGAASSILALSGFGAVPFPLINIHELARKALSEISVKELESKS
jgi:preprotein translocase subunit SecB